MLVRDVDRRSNDRTKHDKEQRALLQSSGPSARQRKLMNNTVVLNQTIQHNSRYGGNSLDVGKPPLEINRTLVLKSQSSEENKIGNNARGSMDEKHGLTESRRDAKRDY